MPILERFRREGGREGGRGEEGGREGGRRREGGRDLRGSGASSSV